MTVQKTYVYQVYRDSAFLGVLQNVISDFSYPQDINTTAVQTVVEVGISADVSSIPVTTIQDEAGNDILDETGQALYEERALDVVGGANPKALIQENNVVKVYEYSDTNVNGVLKFDGYIQDWQAYLTGDPQSDKISFTLISRSIDLEDYILSGGDTAIASNHVDEAYIGDALYGTVVAQNIKFTSDTVVDRFSIGLQNSGASSILLDCVFIKGDPTLDTVNIISGFESYSYGGGNLLQSTCSSITVPVGTSSTTLFTTTLDTPMTCVANTNYYLVVQGQPFAGQSTGIQYHDRLSSGGTPFNQVYWAYPTVNNSSYAMTTNGFATDLYMEVIQASGNTTTTYTSTDPSTMVTSALTNYNSQGGIVTYTGSSIGLTGTTATYTFIVASILDVVKKAKNLAPSDFYYRVDPATSVLYFKETATTATHKLVKGRHFEQMVIGGTVENVVNEVYFTGGNTGTTNLFSHYTNQTSITAQGRRRLASLIDNRVTIQSTADLMANSALNENPGIVYSSPVTVLGAAYDINSINVGDTVQIEGYGNFIDYLLLQVARVVRRPDSIDVTLGVLLKRQSDLLTDALNDLNDLQTVDNPVAPS